MKKQPIYATLLLMAVAIFAFSGCSDDDEELVGNWKKVSDFEGKARSGAVAFNIGEVAYVGTGFAGNKERLNDLWRFNASDDSWTQRASFEGTPRNYAVGFGANGAGYIGLGYGGDDLEYLKDFWKYEPASNTWTQVSDFGGGARRSACAFTLNGKGYVGTGYDDNALKDFWKYDPSTDRWEQVASIGGSKRFGAAVFIVNNLAYVVGGMNNNQDVYDFWAYDASSDTWTQKRKIANVSDESYDDDYLIARTYGVAFVIDGKAYFTCGQSANGSIRTDTWEYDPVTDLWDEKTSFEASPRSQALAINVNGRGMVLTGGSSSTQFDDMHEFFPWEEVDEYDNI